MWLVKLIMPVAIIIMAVQQLRANPRVTRSFAIHTFVLLAGFFAFVALGVVIVVAMHPDPSNKPRALAAVGFMLSWIAYGALWLVRFVPNHEELPRWLLRPLGIVDWPIIAVAIIALAVFWTA